MGRHRTGVTSLLRRWSGGDSSARDELVSQIYQELRRLAHYHLRQERGGHTLQTTALVHGVYLRLCSRDDPQWEDRAHFFAVSARMMRRILVDYSRRRRAEKRGGLAVPLELDEALTIPLEQPVDLIALDGALEQLAAFDARKCQVVRCASSWALPPRKLPWCSKRRRRRYGGIGSSPKAWLFRRLEGSANL